MVVIKPEEKMVVDAAIRWRKATGFFARGKAQNELGAAVDYLITAREMQEQEYREKAEALIKQVNANSAEAKKRQEAELKKKSEDSLRDESSEEK